MKHKIFLAILVSVTVALAAVYFASSSTTSTIADPEAATRAQRAPHAGNLFPVGPPNEPKEDPLSRVRPLTLEEAQSRVHFTIKVPNNLPSGFSVRGASADASSSTFKGVQYTVETVNLFIWDRPITANVTMASDAVKAGAIGIQEMHALGENSTSPFEGFVAGSSGFKTTYLWGYPAITGPNYLHVYHFQRNIAYTITANYPSETLLKWMESMVKG